jgi:hypothetical protein
MYSFVLSRTHCDLKLTSQHFLLDVGGRAVVLVVQSNLAPPHAERVAMGFDVLGLEVVVVAFRLVRMTT